MRLSSKFALTPTNNSSNLSLLHPSTFVKAALLVLSAPSKRFCYESGAVIRLIYKLGLSNTLKLFAPQLLLLQKAVVDETKREASARFGESYSPGVAGIRGPTTVVNIPEIKEHSRKSQVTNF
jgi:hypothetical protein